MSARRLVSSVPLRIRQVTLHNQRSIHSYASNVLLRNPGGPRSLRQWTWPSGAYSIHNVPAARTISFARVLPKLATKLLRIPAMAGGVAVGGLAYLQYQATQGYTYAVDAMRRAGDTAGSTASSLFGSVKDVAGQTWNGFERTKDGVKDHMELPEWMWKILNTEEAGSGKGGGGGCSDGGSPKQSNAGVAAAATGAAFGYSQAADDDDRSSEQAAKDDQMMVLTKKMIEIRSILQQVGQSNALTLPSIVVIGSQSSGKSSVLEAIVGHEFLPKGSNMVTRRPIELTLVNTPDASAEYGEFPALGLGKITDFSQVQRTLTDLNMAVPAKDCVSDDPIQLSIYSPNVPDLSLIDLPGYIQVVGMDQPTELKQKISDLCDKYIQPPNVILAISAADVDLANSTALRASRRVDPRGERTIGVITKMDLVEPQRGMGMLTDKKYPLRLGYVGVVSRVPPSTGLFSRNSGNITSAVARNEHAYFSAHPLEFGEQADVSVGTTILRKKLMYVLENTMASSLSTTIHAIRQELEEATYEFKVQYNDRPLSADSYLAEALDAFKHSFKAFAESFGRPQVRELLKAELDQRVLDLLAQRYWNKPISDLSISPPEPTPLSLLSASSSSASTSELPLYWRRQLDASSSALTKLGIGRLATTVTATALQSQIDNLLSHSTFASHPFARDAITAAASSILNDRFYSTSDQVENCIKPFKFEIDVDDTEWAKARGNVALALKKELKDCESAERSLQDAVGGKRRLKDVLGFVDRVRGGDIPLEGIHAEKTGAGGFSASLLAKGREAAFLRDRGDILRLRLAALKSKPCAGSLSANREGAKYRCPEVFLDAVADKLTATAVLFLNVELLAEFYYHFPRELDARLGKGLSGDEVERFAREDGRVARHLDIIRRKELLELVLEKCDGLRGLEGRVAGERGGLGGRKERREKERARARGGWFS